MSDEQMTLTELSEPEGKVSEKGGNSGSDSIHPFLPDTDFTPDDVDAIADGDLAATAPTIEGGRPSHVLSFVIRGDWGHFRRIDRTVTKQTYRIIPKTTLAGLCAAIVGAPRDSYYEVFAPVHSAVAIAPIGELRTITMSSLGVWTNMDERQRRAGASAQSHSTTVRWPNTTTDRQRHPYEYLVSPAYRIDLAVEDRAFYRTLAARLASKTSHYCPSLGLSELLASIEFLGEYPVEEIDRSAGPTDIYSVVGDGIEQAIPTKGQSYHVERTPHAMTTDEGGRTTDSFVDYAYTMTPTDESPTETQRWTGTIDAPLTAPVRIANPGPTDQYGMIDGRPVAFL